MKHYIKRDAWTNADTETVPTACGINAPQPDISHYAHYEDFRRPIGEICPACLRAMFGAAAERGSIAEYLCMMAGARGKQALHLASARVEACMNGAK